MSTLVVSTFGSSILSGSAAPEIKGILGKHANARSIADIAATDLERIEQHVKQNPGFYGSMPFCMDLDVFKGPGSD